jgi:hypothetical protein
MVLWTESPDVPDIAAPPPAEPQPAPLGATLSDGAPLSADQVAFFHAEGYLALPPLATAAEVAALRAIYAALFARRAGWSDGNYLDFAGPDDEHPRLPQILMPSLYEPALRASPLHDRCHAVARQLLGPAAEFNFDHAITKPAQGGVSTPWHQDKAYYTRKTTHRTITFWIPLQPVTRESGCLRFIPRSHRGPLLEHRHLDGDSRIHGLEAIGVDEARAAYCPLEAGGATIHHHMTLHGAETNVSATDRWAYALGFGTRTATPIVSREHPWNRTPTARELRFLQSLGGRHWVTWRLRSRLVRWGLL